MTWTMRCWISTRMPSVRQAQRRRRDLHHPLTPLHCGRELVAIAYTDGTMTMSLVQDDRILPDRRTGAPARACAVESAGPAMSHLAPGVSKMSRCLPGGIGSRKGVTTAIALSSTQRVSPSPSTFDVDAIAAGLAIAGIRSIRPCTRRAAGKQRLVRDAVRLVAEGL